MNYLDLTFPTPAENLACDEALAERCERGDGGVLRFWEPQTAFVVLGYANHLRADVNQPACQADALPIYRRVSGGGTVLQIPCCLNYALIMQITDHRPLATVTGANRFIMEKTLSPLAWRWASRYR